MPSAGLSRLPRPGPAAAERPTAGTRLLPGPLPPAFSRALRRAVPGGGGSGVTGWGWGPGHARCEQEGGEETREVLEDAQSPFIIVR